LGGSSSLTEGKEGQSVLTQPRLDGDMSELTDLDTDVDHSHCMISHAHSKLVGDLSSLTDQDTDDHGYSRQTTAGIPPSARELPRYMTFQTISGSSDIGSEYGQHSKRKRGVPSKEYKLARFLNQLNGSVVQLAHEYEPYGGIISFKISTDSRRWSSAYLTRPIPNAPIPHKLDLILIDTASLGDKISWTKILAVMELTDNDLTPSRPIAKTLHEKAWLMMRSQPWRRYILLLSMAHSLVRVHYYDHSGLIVTSPIPFDDSIQLINVIIPIAFGEKSCLGYDPTICIVTPIPTLEHLQTEQSEPLGEIEGPNNKTYEILALVWRGGSFIGRGTTCWKVRDRTGKIYTLKDSWVEEPRVSHESDVLTRLKGIEGIPELVAAWNVQFEGKDNSMQTI